MSTRVIVLTAAVGPFLASIEGKALCQIIVKPFDNDRLALDHQAIQELTDAWAPSAPYDPKAPPDALPISVFLSTQVE